MQILIKTGIQVITFSAILLLNSVQAKEKKDKAKDEGYHFTIKKEIPTTPVKDQASSGTCWSFATTSFVETELIRLGKGEHDLSEMYFVRMAYPEKALKYTRLQGMGNFGEGGQGHDVLNIIRRFGMVPESVYTGLNYGTTSHRHDEMVSVLKGILDNSLKMKSGFTGKSLELVNAGLDLYLGAIPDTFQYLGKEYTPKSFSVEMGINPDDYIELTSYQCYPFYQKVDLEIPDNWSHDKYYNLPIDELMQIVDTAITKGYSVDWDGDVSDRGFSHSHGVAIVPENDPKNMDNNERLKWESLDSDDQEDMLYKFDMPLKEKVIDQSLRQKDFDTFKTTDDHLMHLIGTATDQNGTGYYLTKNSWAANSNKMGGKLYMSESYVRLETIAILVHRDAIPQAIKQKLGIK